jgi:hypothetical protein
LIWIILEGSDSLAVPMPAYYAAPVPEFLTESSSFIVGRLAEAVPAQGFESLLSSQIEVWKPEIEALQDALRKIIETAGTSDNWGVLLEFPIPRQARRIDALLLTDRCAFVIEFKTQKSDASAVRQVEGYALDLCDFHKPSRTLTYMPILVTGSPHKFIGTPASAQVQATTITTPELLSDAITTLYQNSGARNQISLSEYDNGEYYPVPSIIDAAIAIFGAMNVREIAHAECGAHNLSKTVGALRDVIDTCSRTNQKALVLVTGVPGSGKTLAGLTVAHDSLIKERSASDPAFFSGNGPLVKILRQAVIRNRMERIKNSELPPQSARDVRSAVEAKIQNIHMFARRHYDDKEQRPPFEHVVVFDEAQRAWSAERNFRKFKRNISEPEMILSVLDRHEWSVLVALIGSGQEIHDGEAGIDEWFRSVAQKYPHWTVYSGQPAGPGALPAIIEKPELNLAVSTRSFRSTRVNDWCEAVLLGDSSRSREVAADLPIFVTRSFVAAKEWLLSRSRGLYRGGLVASSGATRLRAYGIETSTSFHRSYPYDHWFLDEPQDVRSSYQLEVAATEFEIQGLELDFVGMCWGGDLIWQPKHSRWLPRVFRSNRWSAVPVKNIAAWRYAINSYRVLLTRARQEMIIWVPEGNEKDSSLNPTEFDEIAEALIEFGARKLARSISA